MSVGGDGPNVAPVYAPVPCDVRGGVAHSPNPQIVNPDPRAPTDLYSLTPNVAYQKGGNYSGKFAENCARPQNIQKGGAGNQFEAECYRAPNSSIPVYPAESAGFNFRPSTEIGSTLPDGVTAYMDVVPQVARVGGGRTRRSTRRRR
jgi:hypothetical protein